MVLSVKDKTNQYYLSVPIALELGFLWILSALPTRFIKNNLHSQIEVHSLPSAQSKLSNAMNPLHTPIEVCETIYTMKVREYLSIPISLPNKISNIFHDETEQWGSESDRNELSIKENSWIMNNLSIQYKYHIWS